MHGARREQKSGELYNALRDEEFSLYAVAETPLRDLEEPPIQLDWHWTGQNKSGQSRKGGGVGVFWRHDLHWQRLDGECRDHMCVTGNVLAVNTAADNELIVIGDFNGHTSELDWHLDANGKLLLQLAEDLDLVIMNPEPQWEGQLTWCDRGSATNIDYALVSLRLHAMLQRCGVDEEGKYSLGSDHNRLRLDFGHSSHKGKIISWRKKIKRYLPHHSIEAVVEDFEACAEMHEATTYDEYMSALRRVVERHMVPDRRST
ncbi:hypothetical protein HPB51_027250 [Rhipicephalus microplus]|uniref:Endonuclease/exonuclease/phosphatase domain-containing protein n=1 Tax=Rhipicephalus microplus TaxID=6941 RepID=A0A9J6D0Z8_RHIMP|nr:hypothetical protein HPB51_027250 [Rhipicephalus microplus]